MIREITGNQKELTQLCSIIRELVRKNNLVEGYELVADAMEKFPHAPQPHNLIGVLLEKEGDHTTAMKHFRAAWALDPAYIPARILTASDPFMQWENPLLMRTIAGFRMNVMTTKLSIMKAVLDILGEYSIMVMLGDRITD